MNILLIPDKFKGSLSAEEVIASLTAGILKALPEAKISSLLASDGGDGFLDAVRQYRSVDSIDTFGVDPLGRDLRSYFLFDKENSTAYIELAKTSGLVLLKDQERNPLETSTYGTGLQIKKALEIGAKKVFVGLGGSATNDGGIGIAQALGYRFLDGTDQAIEPNGKNLLNIQKIDKSGADNRLTDVSFHAVNDVVNPLHGRIGAAYVYAAQKGANKKEIDLLNKGLVQLDTVVKNDLNKSLAMVEGAGAAGGTAFGLMAFLEAEFVSGINFILDLAEIDKLLVGQKVDCIITGEGKIDEQTLQGKLISGVLKKGVEHGVPVIAVGGVVEVDYDILIEQGFQKVLEIADSAKPLSYNMENASELLEKSIYALFIK